MNLKSREKKLVLCSCSVRYANRHENGLRGLVGIGEAEGFQELDLGVRERTGRVPESKIKICGEKKKIAILQIQIACILLHF